VTNIVERAFGGCRNLGFAYFSGNAPVIEFDWFPKLYDFDASTINYYLPGTTGWGEEYGGRPTAVWLPTVLTDDSEFGVQNGQLGFTISWASDQVAIVDATSNLTTSDWSPVSTNTLIDGSSHFSDPGGKNHPTRFYRLRSP